MSQYLQQYQAELEKICQEEGISYLALFGSHARGDHREDSDVDFIVDFSKKISLLDLSHVALRFEDLLGTKVDIMTERSIKPMLKRFINKDRRVIYHDKNRPRLYQRYPASYLSH